jgi:hypothetical protein
MKKPENIDDLKEMIKSMIHRERFVFKASDEITSQNDAITSVEIYATEIEGGAWRGGFEMNIKISLMDILGKQVGKNAINKYLRLWTDKYYNNVMTYLA